MKKIELFILPYSRKNGIRTRLVVDGHNTDSKDNRLTNLVVLQPMNKWLEPYKKKLFVWKGILAELISELNDTSFQFIFDGCRTDYELFSRSIDRQRNELNRNGKTIETTTEHINKWCPKDTVKNILDIVNDLKNRCSNIQKSDLIDDSLKKCIIDFRTEYHSSADKLKNALASENIGFSADSFLAVIPYDKGTEKIDELTENIAGEKCSGKEYIILTSSSYDLTTDTIYNAAAEKGIVLMHLATDDETYHEEIEKVYFRRVISETLDKIDKIINSFPNHENNLYIINIFNKIDDIYIRL